MLESKIEDDTCDYAMSLGYKCWKWVAPGRRGILDHLFLKRGFWFAIEFKQRGESLEPLQEIEAEEIHEHGGISWVIDTVAGGKTLLNTIEAYLSGTRTLPAAGYFPPRRSHGGGAVDGHGSGKNSRHADRHPAADPLG
jgi:hypothetical protein